MVTILDVAKHAGVSPATVSLVVNGLVGYSDETRERGYAVMLGRTGAKSAYIAGYLRTLRAYRAAGFILISAVITPESRQLLGPSVPIISVAISDKSGSPSVMPAGTKKEADDDTQCRRRPPFMPARWCYPRRVPGP